MAQKLFVGGLPYSTSNDQLRDLFAQCGQVESAVVVTDRDTGRSRGFGFVEMPNEAEAQAAIAALNNQPVNGRPLTVNVANAANTFTVTNGLLSTGTTLLMTSPCFTRHAGLRDQ